jgi:L-histidine Nalpha-methyltransferase
MIPVWREGFFVVCISGNLSIDARLQLDYLIDSAGAEAILHSSYDVQQGLTSQPKTIPAQYFYDEIGSQLFEQICELPEYYLTRTETSIFQTYADKIAQITGPCEIIELGSGSSTKTRILLDAYQRLGQSLNQEALYYCPIDVSSSILELSAEQLLKDYPNLHIHGLIGTYELALAKLQSSCLDSLPDQTPDQSTDQPSRRMICFIGSSLGNFSPVAAEIFLGQVAQALQAGEFFLLGIDLRKSKHILEAAYDDSQGVTAAFNLNMLKHLNDRFKGNFDLNQFEHVAVYNPIEHQIEMHLRSRSDQMVTLSAIELDISLAAGETILSEISRKFDLDEMSQLLAQKNLAVKQIWTDSQQWFGVILCQRL